MHVMARILAGLLVLACGVAKASGETGAAARRFNEVVASPPQLRAFLYQMPKGGDLHNHLSGAAYAEALIRSGSTSPIPLCFEPPTGLVIDSCGDEKLACADPATKQISTSCKSGTHLLADALHDPVLNEGLVDVWSMRDFVAQSGRSGHDHFFDAFSLFGRAVDPADIAAEVVNRAGRQHMRYIELMITFQGSAVNAIGRALPWTGDMAAYRDALIAAGLPVVVEAARHDIDALETRLRANMKCDSPSRGPGCGVVVRWLEQVNRTNPPGLVFAQTLFGALLSQAEPRVVGLDFVAPEDNPVALADYTLHMTMLDAIHGLLPMTHISLHAGELTLGLVAPEDLLFHIRQAVELGHAKRIGHGVDVMYEEDAFALLREMAERRVAVEVNLTSNAQILKVQGADHPFPVYRAAGVPVVLSTDDEGIERIDRTHELQRAVETYGLDWNTLVGLERNTLEYAFVAGDSFWSDARGWVPVVACQGADPSADPPPACATFLAGSEKARLQWSFESDLLAFDRIAETLRY